MPTYLKEVNTKKGQCFSRSFTKNILTMYDELPEHYHFQNIAFGILAIIAFLFIGAYIMKWIGYPLSWLERYLDKKNKKQKK